MKKNNRRQQLKMETISENERKAKKKKSRYECVVARIRCACIFTEVNWILDDAVDQMLCYQMGFSDLFHSMMMMRMWMVHSSFDARDTPESMALCINSFDIRGNGISFFVVECVHVHQLCSSKNCSPAPVQAVSPGNVVSDFRAKFRALNAIE